jgi:F0F1-type ATP synthase membrane subunit c/vacuolar-type H+-ATPase subunit K
MGQPKGGKGGGKSGGQKGGKGGDKGGGKAQGKASQKTGKNQAKAEKQGNTKSSSMVSSLLICCLIVVYSLMIGYLGGTAIKTVGENPELIRMGAMAMGSDSRLKKNVKQVSYGLKELSQLEPKSYNYINESDNTTRHIGVMAQDLKNIMPELVVELDQNKTNSFRDTLPESLRQETLYGVKYQELVPVLINAIKELKDEVEILKQRV